MVSLAAIEGSAMGLFSYNGMTQHVGLLPGAYDPPIITELGLTLSGLEADFYLSGVPDLATMVVKLYEDEDNDSFVRELASARTFLLQSEAEWLQSSD